MEKTSEQYFEGRIKDATNDISIFSTRKYVRYEDAIQAIKEAIDDARREGFKIASKEGILKPKNISKHENNPKRPSQRVPN